MGSKLELCGHVLLFINFDYKDTNRWPKMFLFSSKVFCSKIVVKIGLIFLALMIKFYS